ncbi:MAG: hemolysin family protein [Alphaproteobacteria bacterium]
MPTRKPGDLQQSTMTDKQDLTSSEEPPSGPSIGTAAHDVPARLSGTWFGRLRSLFGLRPLATIRDDLVDALAADSGGGFSAAEREMLANILRLRESGVDDIMVPRADIDAVEIDMTLAKLLVTFRTCGHSRMPVFRETLDDPVGLVHIKDLMRHLTAAAGLSDDAPPVNGGGDAGPIALDQVDLTRTLDETDLVRTILFVPPSMPVSMLLASMQASRMQMALVIDEYGGTDGLVSLEDAIETVVGDIVDEHDDETVAMVVPDGEGGFLADARADLEEVSEIVGVDLTPGNGGEDVDTIGGLIFGLLGRVPVRGELVAAPAGYEFEILDADPRRIKRLRINQRPAGWRSETRGRTRPPQETDSAA